MRVCVCVFGIQTARATAVVPSVEGEFIYGFTENFFAMSAKLELWILYFGLPPTAVQGGVSKILLHELTFVMWWLKCLHTEECLYFTGRSV